MHLRTLAALVMATGCGIWVNATTLDVDGDGHPADQDCDDTDPTIGAHEQWADGDGDRFGAQAVGGGCLGGGNPEDGFVRMRDDQRWDCDDIDADIHPDTRWYADTDGDGFGDEVTELVACSPPPRPCLGRGDGPALRLRRHRPPEVPRPDLVHRRGRRRLRLPQ